MVYKFFEELKDIIKHGVKEFYLKFKYLLLIIVFFVLVFFIFLCKQENPSNIEVQQLKLLGITIENWAQWITIIALPYTAGWAIYQFRKSSLSKKQEKAVAIAKEFSETLVDNLYIINTVYKDSDLFKYMPLEEEKVNLFQYFNVQEVRRIFNNDDYVFEYKVARSTLKEQLDNLYHIELYKASMPYSKYYELKEKASNQSLSDKDLKNIDEIIKKNNLNLPYHFGELVSKTLNKLEFICMNISSKAADSNYIYQSLHQVF